MKKILAILSVISMGMLLFIGNASALPLGGVLQTQLDIRTQGGASSVDVTSDMLADVGDSAWTITASNQSAATLMFEFAAYEDGNSFGIYDLQDASNRVEIFAGADDNNGWDSQSTLQQIGNDFTADGGITVATFSSGSFGYYLDVAHTGNTYFSDTALNSDNYDHLLAYQGTGDQFSVYLNDQYAEWTDNEWVLAWEDLYGGGDQDFTDFVVMVESVQPVPEPATMLLFGVGLIGLAGLGRKKFLN